ncbi:hypothetical protein APL45_gp86 [Escherichia phage vB_EcoP_24B]|uniref:Uncharacterized protein n=1 Tax=Escherichia phage vB_EcoP_24B TaxID=866553 RepID=G3CFL1_9CAUD|nr:hypothetical protein APL45_gp86 [Escherichia phage vB_EcoP_24B]ADN68433.1 hypothetical protein vb_24B_19c [Escherichia phage vB_EcoP_24B]
MSIMNHKQGFFTSRPSTQGDSPCEIFLTNAQSDRNETLIGT